MGKYELMTKTGKAYVKAATTMAQTADELSIARHGVRALAACTVVCKLIYFYLFRVE
jgi:hypothetical protein